MKAIRTLWRAVFGERVCGICGETRGTDPCVGCGALVCPAHSCACSLSGWDQAAICRTCERGMR